MMEIVLTNDNISPPKIGVSVIIPFYRELNWLLEALESVYNQSYNNFEVILINDGSQEDISIVRIKYPLVRLIEIINSGPGKARNVGIELAKGEFIAFLDSDDLWTPTKLDLQIKFMIYSDFQWSHSNYERFYNDKSKVQEVDCSSMQGNIIPKMFLSCSIATPCVVIKRSILMHDSSLRFSETKRVGEDSYFWFKLAEKYPLGFLEMDLSKVRMRGTNAAFQSYLQLKSRADNWTLIEKLKSDYKTVNSYQFIKVGYAFCKVGFDFVSFFNLKIKAREYLSRIVYFFPYVYFKTVSKFYN